VKRGRTADSDAFLEAASDLLGGEGVTVLGVASNTADTLRQARGLRPDVLLVDIGLGDESGFDLAGAAGRGQSSRSRRSDHDLCARRRTIQS
jgi:DNA-binding NarL/FixJ family response regulator